MIIARMQGGLGNQFFIYAFSVYLSKKLNKRVIFDSSAYYKFLTEEYNDFCKKYGVKYEIEKFFTLHTLPHLVSKAIYNIAKFNTHKIKCKYLPHLIKDYNIDLVDNVKVPPLFLSGHFIRKEYAIAARSDLKISDIDLTSENKQYLTEIENYDSISIHIRGKQYIQNEGIKSTFAGVTLEYYERAIELVRERITNPLFFIFSNDQNYAATFFKDSDLIRFINTPGPDFEHFFLMSRCKHNIIVNSTFSWWAAFLNDNKQKIVICPQKWSGSKILNPFYDHLPLDSWIRI